MKPGVEKYGTFGVIIAAAACPICFPKLALLGALIGFGALAQYELYFLIAAQILVLVSFFGNYLAYRKNRNLGILILSFASVMLFFFSLYVLVSEYVSYLAISGMVIAVIWQIIETKQNQVSV